MIKNRPYIIVLYFKYKKRRKSVCLFSSWWNAAKWADEALSKEKLEYFEFESKHGLKRLWYLIFYTIQDNG